jgi:predicted metal-dependent phosphoesterase TrpH
MSSARVECGMCRCSISPNQPSYLPTMRIDLHTHSSVSADGWLSPAAMVEAAVTAGLDKIAITDHREIDGALEAFHRYPDRVIVGEEIHCKSGTHIIGLYLEKLIPSGRSVEETAERIRDQGGVIYAPHPFAYAWAAGTHAHESLACADLVEVFNSRAFLPSWNRRAMEAAREMNLATAASTDAHFPWEFGRAYTEVPSFSDVDGFKTALKAARPVGNQLGSPWLHVGSKLVAEVRRFVPSWRRGAS